MLRKPIVHRYPRRRLDASDASLGVDAKVTFAIVATKLRATFDQPVTMSGVPPYTCDGSPPIAATAVSTTQIDLTYSTPPNSGDSVSVPEKDKTVRTNTGGYVLPVNMNLA